MQNILDIKARLFKACNSTAPVTQAKAAKALAYLKQAESLIAKAQETADWFEAGTYEALHKQAASEADASLA